MIMQDENGDYIEMVEGCVYEENVKVTIKVQ